MTFWLYNVDCIEMMRAWPEGSIDAVVTDPPYELGFIGKKWDAEGIAFSHECWAGVLRVLKSGGHLLAFGGTRTYHRMVCAIEDAGFEIRDSLHWFYGAGFPKSLNVGEGRGTALKPGHEPIVLARRPLTGTVAANVEQFGTGALNIDSCRLGRDNINSSREGEQPRTNGVTSFRPAAGPRGGSELGRWPANVLLDEGAAAELDEQSGTLKSGVMFAGQKRAGRSGVALGVMAGDVTTTTIGGTGGASRFFYCSKPSRSERDAGCDHLPLKSAGEVTDREEGTAGLNSPRAGVGRTSGARNVHPTVKPINLMRYLCRLVTPPGGVVLDPFTGSGTTGIAALQEGFKFVGIEREAEYLAIANARITHHQREA